MENNPLAFVCNKSGKEILTCVILSLKRLRPQISGRS